MKHLNFVPAELRPKLKLPGILIPAGLLCVLVLYVTGSIVLNAIQTHRVQNEIASLDAQNVELTKKLESLGASKERLKMDEAIGNMKKILAKKTYWSGIFREMSVLMPEGVWLTGFSDTKNREKENRVAAARNPGQVKVAEEMLLIKGESESQEIITQFLMGLEKSHHFSGVQLMSSEKESDVRPARYRFEFSVPIKTVTNVGGS